MWGRDLNRNCKIWYSWETEIPYLASANWHIRIVKTKNGLHLSVRNRKVCEKIIEIICTYVYILCTTYFGGYLSLNCKRDNLMREQAHSIWSDQEILFSDFSALPRLRQKSIIVLFKNDNALRCEVISAIGFLQSDILQSDFWHLDFLQSDICSRTFDSQTFGSRTFDSRTFGSQTFDSRTFGSQTFGSSTFGSRTFGGRTFGSRTFSSRTFGSRIFDLVSIWDTCGKRTRIELKFLISLHAWEKRTCPFKQIFCVSSDSRW
jgi:hypothetical protein